MKKEETTYTERTYHKWDKDNFYCPYPWDQRKAPNEPWDQRRPIEPYYPNPWDPEPKKDVPPWNPEPTKKDKPYNPEPVKPKGEFDDMTIEQLESLEKECIGTEDYEKCARIRDELKKRK